MPPNDASAAPRWVIRAGGPADLDGLCRFGQAHIAQHYTPLIGAAAAKDQVRTWWNETHLRTALEDGLVVVAVDDSEIGGVGQRGQWGDDHVIWKLYVHPDHRGRGVGPHLIDALVAAIPARTERVFIEHFAANERAGAFYDRVGFTVQRTEPHPGGDPRLATVWRVRPRAGA